MKKKWNQLKNLTCKKIVSKIMKFISEMVLNVFVNPFQKKLYNKFYDNLNEIVKNIKESNGSSYYEKNNEPIGIITDEFMYNYYKDAINLIPITVNNYRNLITEKRIKAIIFVSCWKGLDGEWRGVEAQGIIPDIFVLAQKNNITTIFQTIEDPPNYQRFLPIAKKAEYIFTSHAESIPNYIKDTENKNVFLLEYGVNPSFHNPISMYERRYINAEKYLDTIFFAGSWTNRYPERCNDIRVLFNGVIDNGLRIIIADRNTLIKTPGYQYPKKYYRYIIPAIEHTLLQKVHKLFNFNININTIKDSISMCAMRVYELQALGVLILSNYALVISHRFPGIFLIFDPNEINYIVSGYHNEEIFRICVENVRNVMTNYTVYDRLNFLFSTTNVPIEFPKRKILVICKEINAHIKSMFERQNYCNKELIEINEYVNKKQQYNQQYDYIAYFKNDNIYEMFYLEDMINAFKYVNIDIVTKDKTVDTDPYTYLYAKADFSLSLVRSKYSENIDLIKLFVEGNCFKLDEYEVNEQIHFIEGPKEIGLIIPIYNNGKKLYERCFRSLLRSSVFDKMNIYLIDDGSTDIYTIKIIDRIERMYSNVKTYFFHDGGSGSASRPRNKGVELSIEKFVTFLDPDNEATNDGYAKLYNILIQNDIEMAFGSIKKVEKNKQKNLGYLKERTLINNPKKTLINQNMRPQSIQACMIKRELIIQNNLQSIEGAVGQDTLFFYELMLNAKNCYYTDELIHIYYAEQMNSTVNTINENFYRKSLILEIEQIKKFKEYGVFNDYCNLRLDYFIENWYIKKLELVNEINKDNCIELLGRIVSLYDKELSNYKIMR